MKTGNKFTTGLCSLGLAFSLLSMNTQSVAETASSEPAPAVSSSNTDIAQGLFEEAINRRDAGDVFKAIRLLELLTETRPDLDRARLELAVSYHQANRYQDAIKELKAVLDKENTPDNVKLSILAYLGQIQNDEKQPVGSHDFSYFLKAGVVHNSNLNASQAVASSVTTAPGTELSSLGSDFTASISHRYNKRDLFNIAETAASVEWLSQATFNSKLYFDENDYNLNILTASTGPAFISPGRWRASVYMQADLIRLGSDNLANFISLNPSITFDFGHFRSLLLESSWTTREYSDSFNTPYDSNVFMLGAGYTTFLTQHATGLEGGFRLSNENAKEDRYSYDLVELYGAAYLTIDERLNAYTRLNYLAYEFDGPDMDLTGSVTRDEKEIQFSAGINYDHTDGPLKGWVMNLELSSIDSDSNADELDFKRTLISANWSRYFQ